MKRFVKLILVLAIVCVLYPTGVAAGSKTAEKKLSKTEAKAVAEQIKAQWLADTKVRLASVYNNKVAKSDTLTMPLWWRVYGQKPADGYSLYISLHGGGGVPAADNDQQWENQKLLYRPADCVYVAPRAPWNIWNMWCRRGIDTLYETVIQMCEAYLDVNPNKVYIMGYSAGGDGVWRMAPRMADRWAAASMMAGHPGDVSLLNLRNTPFMIWCGGLDAAYDRNRLDTERGLQLDSLQCDDPEGYIHETHILADKGHWMHRQDSAAVPWLPRFKRNPYPRKIVWQQEEVRRPSFYWMEIPAKQMRRGMTVRAEIRGNEIDISRCDYSSLTLMLNDEMVDLDRPVVVKYQGKKVFNKRVPRTEANLRKTLTDRGDLSFIFPAVITVKIR